MEDTLSWEIDNFTEKNDEIRIDFSSGGCEWCLFVYPKGHVGSAHMSLFLHVVNPDSLRLGWKRRASYYFAFLDQSGKELYRSPEESSRCTLFCNEMSSWGFAKTLPISKLQEKGFLKKNKLIIKINIEVLEVVHQGNSTENEMLHYGGFHIPVSQIALLSANVKCYPALQLISNQRTKRSKQSTEISSALSKH